VDQFVGGESQDVAIHRCHALDAPVAGVGRDAGIDLVSTRRHSADELHGKRPGTLRQVEVARDAFEHIVDVGRGLEACGPREVQGVEHLEGHPA
jgi:hypothetical protein